MKVISLIKVNSFKTLKRFASSQFDVLSHSNKNSVNSNVCFSRAASAVARRCLSQSVKSETLTKDIDGEENFKLIFTVQKVDLNFVTFLKILSRYQMLAAFGSFPMLYISHVEGMISSIFAATFLGLGGAVIAVSSYYIYSRRNYVCSLRINDQCDRIKVRYLTHFATQRENTVRMKYSETSLDEPKINFDNTFAKLVFKSENVEYLLSLTGGVIPDEKLFLEVFGPTTLSVFKERAQ